MFKKIIVRESGVELLRIVAMLMIVAHHFALHTEWGTSFSSSQTFNTYFISILTSFGKVGVALFFMITGYYLANLEKYKWTKVFRILLPMYFYSITFFVIMLATNSFGAKLSWPPNYEELVSFFPILAGRYWFICQYAVAFLLLPFLKKGLNVLANKDLAKVVAVLVIVIPLTRLIKTVMGFGTLGIFSLPDVLYFLVIGYAIKRFEHFIRIKWAVICLGLSMVVMLCGPKILNFIHWHIASNVSNDLIWGSSSFTTLIMATSFFVLFSRWHFKNRIINYVASLMLGVYLIHENFWVRKMLWSSNGLLKPMLRISDNPVVFVGYSLVTILGVFVVCALIEAVRRGVILMIKDNRKRGA